MYKKKLLSIVTAGVLAMGFAGCSSEPEGVYECSVTGPNGTKPIGKVKLFDDSWDMKVQGKWIAQWIQDGIKAGNKEDDFVNFKVIRNNENFTLNVNGAENGKKRDENMMIFTYNEENDVLNVRELGKRKATDEAKKLVTKCEKVK